MNQTDKIPDLIKRIYEIVNELEELFPGRPFTPDGHMVGSIGEVLAAEHFDLELLPCSYKGHDARDKQGRYVEIKATQGNSISLRSKPERLIIIKLLKDGSFEKIYDGDGKIVWDNSGKMQSNGQKRISLNKIIMLANRIKNPD
jgi:hypothetical protein